MMLANFKNFKVNLGRTIFKNQVKSKKLYFSFCEDKKINEKQNEQAIKPKKKFLMSQRVDVINNLEQVVIPAKIISNSSFKFLKPKISEEKRNIKVKTNLTNPEQFLFDSDFHKNGLDLNQIIMTINKLDAKIVQVSKKQQLIQCIQKINEQRKNVLSKGLSKEKISQQLNEIMLNPQTQCTIADYIHLYTKISFIIEKILLNCQSQQLQYSQPVHYFSLFLIYEFSLLQFYSFYLFKLIHIDDKHNITKMTTQEAQLSWFIVKILSKINYEFKNNTMPFDLQKYVQEFFDRKLQIVYEKGKNQQKEKCNQLSAKYKQFQQGLSFVLSVQQLFKTTHLTYGKHKFFSNFVKKNIFILSTKELDIKIISPQMLENVVQMFNLAVQNLYLDREIIHKFQAYLIEITRNTEFKVYLSQNLSRLLFDIYQKVGSVPNIVYEEYLYEYIYTQFSKDQYHLVQCIKFYLYAQCDDKLLLQSFFNKLQSLNQSRDLIINKKSKHLLHFLFHSLCLKYPSVANHQISRKILFYCKTHTAKDHKTLHEIIKSAKDASKRQNSNQKRKKLFFSPCIQRQTQKIENNYKSKLSTLQQKIFNQTLQQVIKVLNSDSRSIQFYEIKEQFSFCSFELDFVVIKWNSPKRQKILGYLDAECVGLQYSYDSNEGQNDQETAKTMNKLSLVQYEQGLTLIRKKLVRQQILKQYGFKILYVPNKFLYQRHMGKKVLEKKLKEAIMEKFLS